MTSQKPRKIRRVQRWQNDPEFPAAPDSMFELFAKDYKEKVKAKFVPGNDIDDIVKLLQEEWLALSEEERLGYHYKANKLEKMYERLKEEYIKDKTQGPKRPPSAFFVFCAERREHVKRKLGPNVAVTEMSKALGAEWKLLDEKKKATYQAEADRLKEIYRKEKAEYDQKVASRGRPKP
jgi:hypothetical protein|eukprot:Stramenopile-MAST_4_protein_347